ncbi:MAG TPA: hypothetical protein VMW69_12535 [Spirochaetia bacterium]|nr:hypothetical protein [Spirochaetia bacterium]
MEYFALLIPIMALSIPIVAILTRARRQGQIGSPEQERRIHVLEERIAALEANAASMRGDVHELENKQRFLTRLLEERQD